MSNFKTKAINPSTGEVQEITMLDEHYGPHRYGVEFPDGDIWKEELVEFPVDDREEKR